MTPPERICYSVILNGYDPLPTVVGDTNGIRFVCFTDSPAAFDNCGIWTLVEVPQYFSDPKLVSGYLKANAHRLFGHNARSLWVDGSLYDIAVSAAFSEETAIAALPHRKRTTVSEEIDQVVSLGLEHPANAARHRALLRDTGFPDTGGLTATMFLLRDHRNARVRLCNEYWWQVISSGIRRDQLSFDYACWASHAALQYLDADWQKPNRYFSRRRHKNPLERVLTDSNGELFSLKLQHPKLPSTYPSDVVYVHESSSPDEEHVIRKLNGIVSTHAVDGRVEGNYCYHNRTRLHELTPPDPRRSWKREFLRRSVRGRRNALEVGFNAGHSATIALCAQPGLNLHAVDIAWHAYTVHCADKLMETFGTRFRFTAGDSREVLPSLDLTAYDFIHIDGGHKEEVARSDFECVAKKFDEGHLCHG